ncbi:MAG: hypothetical protein A3J24_03315 [Deltaproteobacteria bacterium RIFCSPLOWO2_02_FULL_53_8]|nr:MAG: hypothetical protein A3J24_03315 [Deltaproteobacteria bacterium RIFCSPLOWO2_02_FULL_53_8]
MQVSTQMDFAMLHVPASRASAASVMRWGDTRVCAQVRQVGIDDDVSSPKASIGPVTRPPIG